MAYTDIYTAATDGTHILRKQVTVACQKAATDILNEGSTIANKSQRLQWARKVLRGSGAVAEAERIIWEVLANTTIAANPTGAKDSDVQFVVNSLINTFAGE